jgi:hypothetical protein
VEDPFNAPAIQPYGKVFRQIYSSSVAADWKAMITFQQMIVLADKNGVVDMTHEAISRFTNIPIEIIRHGIKELEKPDKTSRGKTAEGARIIRLDEHRDWGWSIPRHAHYMYLQSDEMRRASGRERQRRYRERQRADQK